MAFAEINYTVYWTINDGKTDEFKTLAAQCNEHVEKNEPNTLFYHWYLGPEDGKAYLIERHASSASMLEHLGSVGPLLEKLLQISKIDKIEAFGNASEDAAKALADFGSVARPHLGGFAR